MAENTPPLDPEDPLLTVPEIAAQLRMTEWTVREWIKAGKLHGFRAGVRNYRVPKSELERFLRERGAAPPAPSAGVQQLEGDGTFTGLTIDP